MTSIPVYNRILIHMNPILVLIVTVDRTWQICLILVPTLVLSLMCSRAPAEACPSPSQGCTQACS